VDSIAKDRIIVRGEKPFAITAIDCGDARFQFQVPNGERMIHIVPFTFRSDDTIGDFREKIIVSTTLGQANLGECTVVGRVSAGKVASGASTSNVRQ
jgi:hypothetical protein